MLRLVRRIMFLPSLRRDSAHALLALLSLLAHTTADDPDPRRNESLPIIEHPCPDYCLCFNDGEDFIVQCTGNRVDRIPEDLPPMTTFLDISASSIVTVHREDLNYLTALEHLHVVFNRNLSKIEPDALKSDTLKYVEMYGNDNLSYIGREAFGESCHARRLYLHDNRQLERLEMILENAPYLEYLNIAKTPMFVRGTIPLQRNLNRLLYLNLKENNLIELDTDFMGRMPNIGVLHLGYNRIITIEKTAFERNVHLEEIYLQWNRLTTIDRDAFAHLELLRYIDLTGNSLTTLPGATVDSLPVTTGICLAFNPLVCDCEAQDLREWMTHLGRANCHPDAFTTCSAPGELTGKVFTDVTVESLCQGSTMPIWLWVGVSVAVIVLLGVVVLITIVAIVIRRRKLRKLRRRQSTSSTRALVQMRTISSQLSRDEQQESQDPFCDKS